MRRNNKIKNQVKPREWEWGFLTTWTSKILKTHTLSLLIHVSSGDLIIFHQVLVVVLFVSDVTQSQVHKCAGNGKVCVLVSIGNKI